MKKISLDKEFGKMTKGQEVLGDPLGEPAYLYCRSSAQVQAEEGRESLSRQLLFAHEKGMSDGRYIPLDMVYWDVWRGKDADRPEFHKMLMSIKDDKRSDIVYIDCTDRLSRKAAVYYVLMYDLTRYGLTPVFEDNDDNLVRHIKIAFDEMELERSRYRQKQANRARAEKGHVISRVPAFGYSLSDDKLAYVINEDEARWVKKIYDWCAFGESLREIARRLTGKVKTRFGKEKWQPATIRRILANKVYIGIYIANQHEKVWIWEGGKQKKVTRERPKEDWIYVDVPAIVSDDQWEKAQQILKQNKKRSLRHARKYEWLLSGLLRCVCGYTLTCSRRTQTKTLATTGEEKTYVWEYYRCCRTFAVHDDDRCDRQAIHKTDLEDYVIKTLEQLFLDPEVWMENLDEHEDEIEHHQGHVSFHKKQIEEIDSQIEELLQIALESRTDSSRKLFSEKMEELEKKKETHEEELSIAKSKLAVAERSIDRRETVEKTIKNLKSLGGLSSTPFDLKRKIITQIVDEIVVDTKEQWFEIKGVLAGGFQYDDSRQVVSMSAPNPSRCSRDRR